MNQGWVLVGGEAIFVLHFKNIRLIRLKKNQVKINTYIIANDIYIISQDSAFIQDLYFLFYLSLKLNTKSYYHKMKC